MYDEISVDNVEMKKLIYHIKYWLPGVLLVLMAVASAMAQKPVQQFEVDQCDTLQFSVVDWPGDRYTWDLYQASSPDFAIEDGDMDRVIYFENGMYEGTTVRVLGLPPGQYFLRVMVWDEVECTNNLLVFLIDVVEHIPEAVMVGDSVCIGEPALTKIVFTGTGPWDVVFAYGDELNPNTVNLNGISDPEYYVAPILGLPVGETDIWVMEISDGCVQSYVVPDPEKARIVIYPKPTNSRIYQIDK